MHSGAGVAYGVPGLHWWAVGFAGGAERAACRLRHGVEALDVAVWPVGAEALDAGENDTRIRCGESVVAESHALYRARRQVLGDDICLLHQIKQQLLATLGLEVERDAALVGVEVEEVVRVARGAGNCAPGIAASRIFDLDDVCTQPRKHLSAGRASFKLGHVNYSDAVERFIHCEAPFSCQWSANGS